MSPRAQVDPSAAWPDGLPGETAVVRRVGFGLLLAHGRPVGIDELADATGLAASRVEASLTELVESGTATRDDAGALVAVGGLSVAATKHRLLLDRGAFFTWCAFDGVGIPAALGVDALAHTRCRYCGRAIDVRLIAGEPAERGGTVVGWLPGGPCANVKDDFCPDANLFCEVDHVIAWRSAAGDPPGRIATLAALAEEGQRVWAEMREVGRVPGWVASDAAWE